MKRLPTENTDKFYRMTHDPVEKLVARLAVPTILVMPGLFGETGIQISQSIADVITFCCSLPLGLSALKKLKGGGADG